MKKRHLQKKHKAIRGAQRGSFGARIRAIFYDQGTPDQILFLLVSVLSFFGLMMIASSGVIYGNVRFDDPYYFFKRQLIGVTIGFFLLLFFQRIDYHLYRKWAFIIFVGALMLLVAALLPGLGVEAYGASRWISLGPLSFQPTEVAKLAVILYLSAWSAGKGERRIADFHEGLVPFVMILGAVSFLIFNQPDIGTMGMLIIIAMAIFFIAGARLKHIMLMIGIGFVALFALIKVAPYRLQRFMTFLDPNIDPQGAGYQIKQALIAIGSGGFFGLGLGHSRQKVLYLPEPTGDSIFAIIAEEFGFLGTSIVVVLFLFLMWRIFRIAANAPDLFGRLVASGIGVWLVGQAFINIAAITAIIPLTGITLPFVSYGGTSIVFVLVAVGILLNISRQTKC